MATNPIQRFQSTLEEGSNNLGWIIARVPFDVHAAWPKLVRLRVQVELADQIFRTSLFPDAVHGGHFLLVNKKMQKAAGASVGDPVDFAVSADLDPREAILPPELTKLLRADQKLYRWFDQNSESMRREIGKWVDDPKTPVTRQRRAQQMAERLLLAMEAETTLPPILERAFLSQPAARQGWNAMTPTQRRNHLLGLFYYQSPEAQQNRLTKLLEAALQRADDRTKSE